MSIKNYVSCSLSEEKYFTKANFGNHIFYLDEPEDKGGKDKAPTPKAYLLGALTSCIAITLRMYSERKGWDLGQINVSAELKEILGADGKKTTIEKQITFENDLTEVQIKRLLVIADKCPVSKMLANGVEMSVELVDELGSGVEV